MKKGFYKYSIIILCIAALCSCKSEEEIIKINYSYQGCFGSGREELTVYQIGSITKATLKVPGRVLFSNITQYQLDSIYLFIKKIKDMEEEGYCTTKGSYSVSANEEVFYKKTESCSLHGILPVSLMFFTGDQIYH